MWNSSATPLNRYRSYHMLHAHAHAHAHAFQMRIVSMQQIALRRMVYEMLEPSGALLLSQSFSSCMPNLLIPTQS